MSLFVVPLAADETAALTFGEWEELLQCEVVEFEDQNHPLLKRLWGQGVETRGLSGAPQIRERHGLVVDPASPLLVDLAQRGARISPGAGRAPDDLTAAHGAYVGRRASSSLASLALVMARLRGPDGCPWDREQSHASLRVHLIEEAHEVLDAIDRGAVGAELEEELGDLLLQVFFHAQMAHDDARFDVAGVADAIVAKLLHRHPHVFGDVEVSSAGEVVANWESIKAAEKERSGPLEGIPPGLPALLHAYKVQKRAAGAGFEADAAEAVRRLGETLAGDAADADEAALGEALFWLVALARARGIDPEGALRTHVTRFKESLGESGGRG